MGPNGSGKTTLFRVIDGTLLLDSGNVNWQTTETFVGTKSAFPEVVHIPQDPWSRLFPALTLAEHFVLADIQGRRPSPVRRAVVRGRSNDYSRYLEEFDRNDLLPYLDRRLEECSGGMRQAAAIMVAARRTIVGDANNTLFLLDEPTSSLDAENEQRVLEIVRRLWSRGATIMMVTHDADLAKRVGGSLVMMKNGQVVRQWTEMEKAALEAGEIAQMLVTLNSGHQSTSMRKPT
jgi:putative ABC transport system ATP-binding protein